MTSPTCASESEENAWAEAELGKEEFLEHSKAPQRYFGANYFNTHFLLFLRKARACWDSRDKAPFPNKCLQQPLAAARLFRADPFATPCSAHSSRQHNAGAQSYLFFTAENFDKQQQAAKASLFIFLTVYILKNGSHHYGSYQKAGSDPKLVCSCVRQSQEGEFVRQMLNSGKEEMLDCSCQRCSPGCSWQYLA